MISDQSTNVLVVILSLFRSHCRILLAFLYIYLVFVACLAICILIFPCLASPVCHTCITWCMQAETYNVPMNHPMPMLCHVWRCFSQTEKSFTQRETFVIAIWLFTRLTLTMRHCIYNIFA